MSETREYRKNEFCDFTGCDHFRSHQRINICTIDECRRTAYDFHKWLKTNGFKIVKDIK